MKPSRDRTSFTDHAYEQLRERSLLHVSQVKLILDEGLYIPIGNEVGTNRVHKLYYSVVDKNWFVAIQDEVTKGVVTILPHDYHNRWVIAQDVFNRARALIIPEPDSVSAPTTSSLEPSLPEKPPVSEESQKVESPKDEDSQHVQKTTFLDTCLLEKPGGVRTYKIVAHTKTGQKIILGWYALLDPRCSIGDVGKNPDFLTELLQLVAPKVTVTDPIKWFSITSRNGKYFLRIDVPDKL